MTYKSQKETIKKPVIYMAEINFDSWTSGSYFTFASGSGNLSPVTSSNNTITFSSGRYMFEAYPAISTGLNSYDNATFSWEIDGVDSGILGRFNEFWGFTDKDLALASISANSNFDIKLKIINSVGTADMTSSLGNGHIVVWSENEL